MNICEFNILNVKHLKLQKGIEMPIIIKNQSNLEVCNISNSGIGMVSSVVNKTGWNIGDVIQVGKWALKFLSVFAQGE